MREGLREIERLQQPIGGISDSLFHPKSKEIEDPTGFYLLGGGGGWRASPQKFS